MDRSRLLVTDAAELPLRQATGSLIMTLGKIKPTKPMNTGKCPYCGFIISEVRTEAVTIGNALQKQWHGVSYVCPSFSCSKVISIQMDPISLKSDTIEGVAARLGR